MDAPIARLICLRHAESAGMIYASSALCRDGPALWGAPLPHAVPFPLTRHGARWHVQWAAAEER